MAEDIRVVSGDAFALLLSGTVESGQVFADLRPGALSESAGTNVEWVQAGTFTLSGPGALTPASSIVPAPVTGTLTRVLVAATAVLNANVVVNESIGGVAVTGGTATLPSGSAAGTVASASPTGANAVTLGASAVLVTPTTTATSPPNVRVTVLLGFTRSTS